MSETRSDRDALLESFDVGEDVERHFDFERPELPSREVKRVNVDFPVWVVTALDREAAHVGANRRAVAAFPALTLAIIAQQSSF